MKPSYNLFNYLKQKEEMVKGYFYYWIQIITRFENFS